MFKLNQHLFKKTGEEVVITLRRITESINPHKSSVVYGYVLKNQYVPESEGSYYTSDGKELFTSIKELRIKLVADVLAIQPS